MSKKIFRAIWIVALVVCIASVVIIMGVLYNYFTSVQMNQLEIEMKLVTRGVILNGEGYFDGLETDNYRITWITADGTVLYDNEAESGVMANHLEREEIRQAFEEGTGKSTRISDTMPERRLYIARLMPDGTVISLSATQATAGQLFLDFALPVAVVIIFALVLSFIFAARLSKRITDPINSIDPDDPLKYADDDDYAEIAPLLKKLDRQQEQLKVDKAELEKTSLIRQEFTANASHELKTPLHAISGYAELIEKGMVRDEDVKPFAKKILAESGRMTKIVEDIIDLTKLDSGGIGMAREDADLYEISERAVDALTAAADVSGVKLVLTGDHAVINGVPQVLYSIVYNLCDNAIKYSYRDGVVYISIFDGDDSAELTVSDNGIGIPPEHQGRVFERFYRVDKSRSKEVGGTGLGLSIVKHAANLHKASIQLFSTPGEGSVFKVKFPKEKGGGN